MRTAEVPAGVSLVQLHRMLLACFGWSGECLHVFEIRGRSFSNSGYVDAERSSNVGAGSLGLRVGERFCWRYDFCSDWIIDVRVQAAGDIDTVRVVSGRRSTCTRLASASAVSGAPGRPAATSSAWHRADKAAASSAVATAISGFEATFD